MTKFPTDIEFTFRSNDDVLALRVAAHCTGVQAFRALADLAGDIFYRDIDGTRVVVPAEMRREVVAACPPTVGQIMDYQALSYGSLRGAEPGSVLDAHATACAFLDALDRIHLALAPDVE